MIHQIFSVRDNVSEAYLQPFFSINTATAIRAVKDAVNDRNHEFYKHSDDYSLWGLGVFDDATGVIDPNPNPTRLLNLVELVEGAG